MTDENNLKIEEFAQKYRGVLKNQLFSEFLLTVLREYLLEKSDLNLMVLEKNPESVGVMEMMGWNKACLDQLAKWENILKTDMINRKVN